MSAPAARALATRGRPPAEIADALRALGPLDGRALMVHASLRRLGPVEGGVEGVIAALRAAIGARGTLLMMIAADDDEPFDRLRTPADPSNGALAEAFRRHPGVEVNDHPACRFAAWGPEAAALLAPQPLHDYYGEGSPLARLTERGGAVLRLGPDDDTLTLTHYAENLARLPGKRRVRRVYRRADVGEIAIEGIDDDDGIADWPQGDYFAQIWLDFRAAGLAAIGAVGGCTAELIDARRFVAFAVAWIERNLAASGGAAR